MAKIAVTEENEMITTRMFPEQEKQESAGEWRNFGERENTLEK